MVSLIAAPYQLRLSCSSFLSVNPPAVFVVRLAARQVLPGLKQNLTALKRESRFLGSVHSRGVARRCKSSENEDYSALEQEVLEFMLQSEDPDRFPTRKELVNAGRRDLAEAIVKRGGWMTRGWDLASDDESEKAELDVLLNKWNSISAKLGQSEMKHESKIQEICLAGENSSDGDSAQLGGVNGYLPSCSSSLPPASSSGRSEETEADGDDGIEGMLNRLDKQRNLSLDLLSKKNQLRSGGSEAADSRYPRNDAEAGLNRESNTVAIQEKMLRDIRRVNNPEKSLPNSNKLRNSLKPDAWRTWSIQRAGFPNIEFEAAEINFDRSEKVIEPASRTDEIIALQKGDKDEPPEMIENLKHGDIYNGDKIKSRLHNLELELSSALRVLRSNAVGKLQKVDREHISEDYMNLSDDLEFQENEIMNAQNKLRSLRARLAVLEGRVALTKIDTQKLIEEKQNRISDSRKALQLLRTICVVWPNSASEVFLTGSFDGWATQRKMEKSGSGVFSLLLRLYPGRYEFKFIVDGVWKVDPLRPIVNNNGYENNQLIVT